MTTGQSPEAPLLEAPPEARLIRKLREKPPYISVNAAAEAAGISHTRWRQIEDGYRTVNGGRIPEVAKSRRGQQTVARMALVVGGTPQMFEDAGVPAVAAELASLITQAAVILPGIPARTRHVIARKMGL